MNPMSALVLVVIMFMLMTVDSFISELGCRRPASTSYRMKSNNNSYRRMLKKAKDGQRKKQNASVQPDVAPQAQSNMPREGIQSGEQQQQAWDQGDTESMSTREKAKFKNQVPFSEDMYETIKACITILSDRSNIENPKYPSADEAHWFKEAVEVILEDARMYGPPKRPERVAIPSPDER